MATHINEVLSAAPLVKTFGRERYEVAQFEAANVDLVEENIRALRLQKAAARANELITAVGTGTIVLFGSLQALNGQMTPGALLVFISYAKHLYKPVKQIAKLSVRFSRAMVSADRLREILDIEPEIQDAPDAIEAHGLRFDIAFDGVSFAYEGGGPVLHNVSFTIPAGKRVALVGASGAGKSTVANLILRLYDPSAGRVLIDGVDLRRYRREALRREIGVVMQDSILFGVTVRENIAYGRPDASPEEIEQAARAVHAHDFIEALPAGYDEVLGEGGVTLSGGQRQRICLARALIKRPSILIMDEPASGVEAESAVLIRDAVRQVQAGKTTLLIAHAIDSVRDADHILVLNEGRIVEQGTHDQLLRLGGHYCEIFQVDEPRLAASPSRTNVDHSG